MIFPSVSKKKEKQRREAERLGKQLEANSKKWAASDNTSKFVLGLRK